jgi:hypothetical protein
MNDLNPFTLVIIALMAFFNDDKPSSKSSMKGNPMIRAFNSFQLVTLFAAMPHLIGWLNSNPFPFSPAAFYTSIVAYIVLFGVLCVAVFGWCESN